MVCKLAIRNENGETILSTTAPDNKWGEKKHIAVLETPLGPVNATTNLLRINNWDLRLRIWDLNVNFPSPVGEMGNRIVLGEELLDRSKPDGDWRRVDSYGLRGGTKKQPGLLEVECHLPEEQGGRVTIQAWVRRAQFRGRRAK